MHFALGAMGVNARYTFEKQSAKYFADHPEVAARIENKEVEVIHPPVVVTEYNKWKPGRK